MISYGGDVSIVSTTCDGRNFNPRLHTEATALEPYLEQIASISIHASIRRRRPEERQERSNKDFNPRLHTEATLMRWILRSLLQISIHASIRRRHLPPNFSSLTALFQSTPPYGGDRFILQALLVQENFNPRLHTEATACRGMQLE